MKITVYQALKQLYPGAIHEEISAFKFFICCSNKLIAHLYFLFSFNPKSILISTQFFNRTFGGFGL